MMSLRSDFYGFLQSDDPLFKARLQIDVVPLGEEGLREVVSRPAQALGARFEPEELIGILAQRAAEDSAKDAGDLPLLSYTLDDMWRAMVEAGDGKLRLPVQSVDLGRVLVERANTFLAENPASEDAIRRILTLKLATVREDGEPTRRREFRAEFSDEEWRLASELAGYPNRLLVTATTAAGETYAEVAHEALFRRWAKLKEWIAAEREFLAWRSGLEAARRTWEKTADRDKDGALLMGFALTQAQRRLGRRSGDLPEADRRYIAWSRKAARRRSRRFQALVGALLALVAVGVAAWWDQDRLKEELYVLANVTALSTAEERALKAGDLFKECRDCPEMIVVPAGTFLMGSPEGRWGDVEPQHEVTIAKPFAVAKFALTFDEWDACAARADCLQVPDQWGRDRLPAVNVAWDDARAYVKWLTRITGKPYRLLAEAEYEYAARAGTQTAYPWGDEIDLNGKVMANCMECGSQWDGQRTAPVGSFASNRSGLYDMAGNVWEWTEDCWHGRYYGAPADGSAWTSGDCDQRVVRGGSWRDEPDSLRSAQNFRYHSDTRGYEIGFRVARTLAP